MRQLSLPRRRQFLAGRYLDACRNKRLVHAAVLKAAAMTRRVERSASPFTAPERDLIRREFALHFGAFPSLNDGIFLRTGRAGPEAGQPKLPPAVRSMLERGLVEIRWDLQHRLPCAVFTETGLAQLRQLAEDRRALDPVRFAHIRRELGLQAEFDGGLAG